jgi:hypothetical protein
MAPFSSGSKQEDLVRLLAVGSHIKGCQLSYCSIPFVLATIVVFFEVRKVNNTSSCVFQNSLFARIINSFAYPLVRSWSNNWFCFEQPCKSNYTSPRYATGINSHNFAFNFYISRIILCYFLIYILNKNYLNLKFIHIYIILYF